MQTKAQIRPRTCTQTHIHIYSRQAFQHLDYLKIRSPSPSMLTLPAGIRSSVSSGLECRKVNNIDKTPWSIWLIQIPEGKLEFSSAVLNHPASSQLVTLGRRMFVTCLAQLSKRNNNFALQSEQAWIMLHLFTDSHCDCRPKNIVCWTSA